MSPAAKPPRCGEKAIAVPPGSAPGNSAPITSRASRKPTSQNAGTITGTTLRTRNILRAIGHSSR
ncbi:MAG: hypothetical protein N2Z67_04565 [Acetobacteraceae bacterium]|nr:hypothetical protein [Acetobacteraceae bacterium]